MSCSDGCSGMGAGRALLPIFPGAGGRREPPLSSRTQRQVGVGLRREPRETKARRENPKNGRRREGESCDYYPSRLGLPFGAGAGYHTFLQSPPSHSTPGPPEGVVRDPHSACRAGPNHAQTRGQGVRQGGKWLSGEPGAPAALLWAPRGRWGWRARTERKTQAPGERKAGWGKAVLQRRKHPVQPIQPTLSGEGRATATARDASTRRPRAEPLSPRRLRALRATTRTARRSPGAAAPRAAPPAGRSAAWSPFPRLPRPRRGCGSAAGVRFALQGRRALGGAGLAPR